jgi:diaminohydroxyphosphoribosylaminopyrimidine deaminase/5-amino-6-(5-phosphoribosylamino)uracil reductase
MTVHPDRQWMNEALRLAKLGEGKTRPNPPVGAVIVQDGRCLVRAFHRRAGGGHAEALALQRAGRTAQGATLYVTLEPCCTTGRTPACTDGIIKAGIARVVVATRDPNPAHQGRGLQTLRKAGIQITEGVCRQEADALLAPFRRWILNHRPFLTLKLACTLDGRIADRRGDSKWITGPKARRIVQNLRKQADAVMVGARTVQLDDPSLLCRVRSAGPRWRVVVDETGQTPLSSRVLNDEHTKQTIMAVTRSCAGPRREAYAGKGAAVWALRRTRGGVSMLALLDRLGREGMLHVLCEGGGRLAAQLVRDKLVDRFVFFMAPKILGGDGVAAIGGRGWFLDGAPELNVLSVDRVGSDIMVTAEPITRPAKQRGRHVHRIS